ncbi:MAG: dehydrogenase, partial [SAR324 cluster bacterium]|nr:dehydrogenase [SAR324 cluster bacterium]
EPTADSLPLAKLDNVVLSPHSIAWTEELFRDVGRMACGSILDLAEGRKPHGLLNPEVWDTPAFRRKLQLD